VAMFYLMIFINNNPGMKTIPGAANLKMIMSMGVGIIAIFACIFIFYTNSFIIKNRKKEIGVYNILGMEKRHIAKVLGQETFFVAVIAIAGGVLSGIVFSKLILMLLYRMLGFQESVLENIENIDFDAILCGVIDSKKPYEEKYTKKIPVAAAGGIFDRQDIDHVLSLGADAVQIASRFVVTKECDASDAYKRAYIEAGKGNIQIVKSPVGMPGRAVRNAFIRQVEQHKQEITGCYQCLEKCNPKEVPYCITQALIHAVKGELEQGLIFCGENVSRIHEMTTVPELMRELTQG
jgi:NAD(P)H-dependent flavin oxidoreductase YrpB (nitropropane dioxygenase family)